MKSFLHKIILLSCLITLSTALAANVPISLFPMKNYNQNINYWMNPKADNYRTPLLSQHYQQQRLQIFLRKVYGKESPWNAERVSNLLSQKPGVYAIEQNEIQHFSNANQSTSNQFYGENFLPHTQQWIAAIQRNMNLQQFKEHLIYQQTHRGIMTNNAYARALPTNDPAFSQFTLPGQGYPFDNLQLSAIWAGTPIYVIGVTKDKSWSLVLTPSLIAWVQSSAIAIASDEFIKKWHDTAKHSLAAITKTKTSIVSKHRHFLFTSYIGASFPAINRNGKHLTLLVPQKDRRNHAVIETAVVANTNASIMPLTATRQHFAMLMHSLIGRPYGWGGIYFYNDCSQETKSLFTPFAIWLPRHSSTQVTAGQEVNKSHLPIKQRINYLLQNGHPFMTIIYLGGHVILYIGKYHETNFSKTNMTAMTYQELWGMEPRDNSRRAIVSKAVIFPLLVEYPEDKTLHILAKEKYFVMSYLDKLPTKKMPPTLSELAAQ